MSLKATFTAAVAVLTLFAGPVLAESEGNGDPFPFQAGVQATAGSPFVAETGSAGYPRTTGNTTQPSTLTKLEPASGSEAVVQTAGSLPRGFDNGSVASQQARSVNRYLANHPQRAPHFEARGGSVRG